MKTSKNCTLSPNCVSQRKFWQSFSSHVTSWREMKFDVRGSVHNSIIHTGIANKMQQCIKIYYSMLIWSSTCFGWHTAHHQDPKTAQAASGFAYVKGCWTLSASSNHNVQQPFTYAKPEAASAVLSSWWRAGCRPKHVGLHINME